MKKQFQILAFSALSLSLAACTIDSPIDFNRKSSQNSAESENSIESAGESEFIPPVSDTSESSSEAVPAEPAKVLFVGNSFTYYNNLDDVAESLGQSLGMDIECDRVTKGSQKLIDTAKSTDEVGAQFDAAINSKSYTHIVLQDQSTLPLTDYNSFYTGVKNMRDKILAKFPDCKIYLYSTWGYTSMAEARSLTIPQAEEQIRAAYVQCGAALNIPVTYVGKAFSYAYEHNPEINLYFTDDKHPSYAGTFLSASTHLGSMFGVDVRPSSFHGDQSKSIADGGLQYISEAEAENLKSIAYEVAFNLI